MGYRFKTEVIWDDPDVDLTAEDASIRSDEKLFSDASGNLQQTSLDWTRI
jgi:hypothetical protein